MKQGEAIQNKLKIEEFKKELLNTDKEVYYLFITAFNLGLGLQELSFLKKRDLYAMMKERTGDLIDPLFVKEIEVYLEQFREHDYIFPREMDEHYFRILSSAACRAGIEQFGEESLRKTFGYFHYQRFRDIERLRKILGLVSPTATLHYIGYKDDRYLCFYCSIGCLWRKN